MTKRRENENRLTPQRALDLSTRKAVCRLAETFPVDWQCVHTAGG
jgi:hypothetical protein